MSIDAMDYLYKDMGWSPQVLYIPDYYTLADVGRYIQEYIGQ